MSDSGPVEVRRPPVQAVMAHHLPRKSGKCPWCGLPITETTPVRKQIKTIHNACSLEMSVVTSPEFARNVVFDRDKGICVDCKLDCSQIAKFRPRHPPGHAWHISWTDGRGNSTAANRGYQYVALLVISLWHCDHKVPLWKVRHMPDLQRIEYFKLANLVTRCEDCHQFKTDEEARERAHYRLLNNENKPKRSRGFQKRSDFVPRAPRDINDP